MMDMNLAIHIANLVLAVMALALGAVLLWAARPTLRRWPVSALVAAAGLPLVLGAIYLQATFWRVWGGIPVIGGPDGSLTLALRLVGIVVIGALIRRVVNGRLLTDADHARIGG